MKAFTVHGVFKIARFTDAPCINIHSVAYREYGFLALETNRLMLHREMMDIYCVGVIWNT